MTNVALAKPTSVGNVIIVAGPIGLVAANKFHIKLRRFRSTYNVRVVETTGDGDAFPFFEHSLHLYERFVLQGWMLSEFAIGLKQLVTDENPLKTKMKLNLSANRSVEKGTILETVTIDWDRVGVHVGLAIAGQMHDTDPAGANFEV